jgi:hypothetical protein
LIEDRCGKIGMTTWPPDGNVATLFMTLGKYAPLPPNLDPPLLWGTEDHLHELFGDGITELSASRRQFMLRAPSAEAWLDNYRQAIGPVIRAFAALDSNRQDQLAIELVSKIEDENVATDGTLKVPLEYLEVIAIAR